MCQTLQNQQLVPAGQTDRQTKLGLGKGQAGDLVLDASLMLGGGEYAAALLAPDATWELAVGVRAPVGL